MLLRALTFLRTTLTSSNSERHIKLRPRPSSPFPEAARGPWLRPSLVLRLTQYPRRIRAARCCSLHPASANRCVRSPTTTSAPLPYAPVAAEKPEKGCMPCHPAHPTRAQPRPAYLGHPVCAVRLRQENATVSCQRDHLCPPSSQTTRQRAHHGAGLPRYRLQRPTSARCLR